MIKDVIYLGILGLMSYGTAVQHTDDTKVEYVVKEHKYKVEVRDTYYRMCRKESATGDESKIEILYNCNGQAVFLTRGYVEVDHHGKRSR